MIVEIYNTKLDLHVVAEELSQNVFVLSVINQYSRRCLNASPLSAKSPFDETLKSLRRIVIDDEAMQ